MKPVTKPRRVRGKTVRTYARSAVRQLVMGAAYATGTGAVGLIFWWAQQR